VPASCQQRDGADQFNGTAAAGLFLFSSFDVIPRTTRVVLTALSYHTGSNGGAPGDITFFAVRPAVTFQRILLGRALSAEIIGPSTEGNVTFCGKVLPRDPPGGGSNGAHWEVQAFTQGKNVTAVVCVDFVLEPFPDTDERDSG
jgi:hypothetical protein